MFSVLSLETLNHNIQTFTCTERKRQTDRQKNRKKKEEKSRKTQLLSPPNKGKTPLHCNPKTISRYRKNTTQKMVQNYAYI